MKQQLINELREKLAESGKTSIKDLTNVANNFCNSKNVAITSEHKICLRKFVKDFRNDIPKECR